MFFRFQEDYRVIAAPLGKRISPMAETNQKTGNPLLVSAALEQSQDAIEHIVGNFNIGKGYFSKEAF